MGRIAVVTGGTRGIGAAIALRLQKAGYNVVATYHSNDEAANAFKARSKMPVFKFDVSAFDECSAGVKRIQQEVGPIEILVNNAGITRDSTMHKMDYEQWEQVLRTNLTSCFNMCRNVIDGMRARKFGRIVNISSVNGQAGMYGQTNYSATKAGIIGFTKALALEGASSGITVNALASGYVATEMVRSVPEKILEKIVAKIPVGRLADPDEIARGVEFLVADASAYTTGSTLSINGGLYMD
ncbi:MAG: 3-oxoacyl-[acyl-carrier-protein] reductase [Gammaproteobacteria bacterium]|nr:3-oxoacyl-[acyl-carrier-protein] reductase [Gammaproteobacteria bacterium]